MMAPPKNRKSEGEVPSTVMMYQVGSIPEFNIITDDWQIYEERLEQYFIANNIPENKKVPVLLTLLGEAAYKYLRDLCSPELPKDTSYEQLCEVMSRQFSSRVSIYRNRIKFYSLQQEKEESISRWFARLKGQAADSKFGNCLETVLKDKFVCGLQSTAVQDRLCEEGPRERSLLQLYELALTKESAIFECSTSKRDADIGKVSTKDTGRCNNNQPRPNQESGSSKCSACGKGNHSFFTCRFRKYKCNRSGKIGHLAAVCRAKVGTNCASPTNEEDHSSRAIEWVDLGSIGSGSTIEPMVVEVEVSGQKLQMKLDTGAGVSVIPEKVYLERLGFLKLHPSNIRLRANNQQIVVPLGEIYTEVSWLGRTSKCRLLIAPTGTRSLVGRDWLQKFCPHWVTSFRPPMKQVNAAEPVQQTSDGEL
ncbi:uncharacterized protein [Rhodnius prolixus]|uniref:uncharacterized protein n=1 Tax=Rhodnius prolixus TaxID=13249 RepID=UPI003D18AD6C